MEQKTIKILLGISLALTVSIGALTVAGAGGNMAGQTEKEIQQSVFMPETVSELPREEARKEEALGAVPETVEASETAGVSETTEAFETTKVPETIEASEITEASAVSVTAVKAVTDTKPVNTEKSGDLSNHRETDWDDEDWDDEDWDDEDDDFSDDDDND